MESVLMRSNIIVLPNKIKDVEAYDVLTGASIDLNIKQLRSITVVELDRFEYEEPKFPTLYKLLKSFYPNKYMHRCVKQFYSNHIKLFYKEA